MPTSARKLAYDKAYYEAHREELNEKNRNRRLQRDFGITADEYDEMLYHQGGVCAICKESQPVNLCIDHDHSCCPGRTSCGFCVRGLVCTRCNVTLGMSRDRIDVLQNAIEYLQTHERKK